MIGSEAWEMTSAISNAGSADAEYRGDFSNLERSSNPQLHSSSIAASDPIPPITTPQQDDSASSCEATGDGNERPMVLTNVHARSEGDLVSRPSPLPDLDGSDSAQLNGSANAKSRGVSLNSSAEVFVPALTPARGSSDLPTLSVLLPDGQRKIFPQLTNYYRGTTPDPAVHGDGLFVAALPAKPKVAPNSEGPLLDILPLWNADAGKVGWLGESHTVFHKKRKDGSISLIYEQQLRTRAAHGYALTFRSGSISASDGIGFVFADRVPCSKNVSRLWSIFINRHGYICQRMGGSLIKPQAPQLPPLNLGRRVTLLVDLDLYRSTFEVFATPPIVYYANNFRAITPEVCICRHHLDFSNMAEKVDCSSGYLCASVTSADVVVKLEQASVIGLNLPEIRNPYISPADGGFTNLQSGSHPKRPKWSHHWMVPDRLRHNHNNSYQPQQQQQYRYNRHSPPYLDFQFRPQPPRESQYFGEPPSGLSYPSERLQRPLIPWQDPLLQNDSNHLYAMNEGGGAFRNYYNDAYRRPLEFPHLTADNFSSSIGPDGLPPYFNEPPFEMPLRPDAVKKSDSVKVPLSATPAVTAETDNVPAGAIPKGGMSKTDRVSEISPLGGGMASLNTISDPGLSEGRSEGEASVVKARERGDASGAEIGKRSVPFVPLELKSGFVLSKASDLLSDTAGIEYKQAPPLERSSGLTRSYRHPPSAPLPSTGSSGTATAAVDSSTFDLTRVFTPAENYLKSPWDSLWAHSISSTNDDVSGGIDSLRTVASNHKHQFASPWAAAQASPYNAEQQHSYGKSSSWINSQSQSDYWGQRGEKLTNFDLFKGTVRDGSTGGVDSEANNRQQAAPMTSLFPSCWPDLLAGARGASNLLDDRTLSGAKSPTRTESNVSYDMFNLDRTGYGRNSHLLTSPLASRGDYLGSPVIDDSTVISRGGIKKVDRSSGSEDGSRPQISRSSGTEARRHQGGNEEPVGLNDDLLSGDPTMQEDDFESLALPLALAGARTLSAPAAPTGFG